MRKYIFLFTLLILTACDDVIDRTEDILGVPDISGKEVQILAPANNIQTPNRNIRFSWEEVAGANQYQLQIARPSFEEAEVILVDKTFSKLNYERTLSVGTYQWRIRAMNDGYETPYTTHTLQIVQE